jgi:hypothetical protein
VEAPEDPRVSYTVKELLLRIDDRFESFEERFADHVAEDAKRFGRLERFAAVATAFATTALTLATIIGWGSIHLAMGFLAYFL